MQFWPKGRKLYILLAILVLSIVGVVVGLVFLREPAEPEYTIQIDVSKPSGYLEYVLAEGETLYGKLVVDTGNVAFVVIDYWNNHIHDIVVRAGNSYSFSIKARQTGERYWCYFGFLAGEANLPRSAMFYSNMSPTG
jgi:hypothetical protein